MDKTQPASPVSLEDEQATATLVEAPPRRLPPEAAPPGTSHSPESYEVREYAPRPSRFEFLADGRFWLFLALGIPFVLLAMNIARAGAFFPFGDQAFIDIAVQRATHFKQLTGPYSRFGWDHPGPLYFYFMAPVYWMFSDGVRTIAGALLINFAMVMTTLLLAVRFGGRRNAASIALALMVFMLALGPELLDNPWNPSITVLAMFTAVTAVAVGSRLACVAVLAVCSSLIVQSHVGTSLIVGTLIALALILHVAASRLKAAQWLSPDARLVPRTRSVFLIEGLVLLCWLPPLVQQVQAGMSGNLGRVAHFFLSGGGAQHSYRDAINKVVGAVWLPNSPLVTFPPAPPVSPLLWFAVAVFVAFAAAVLAWRQRSRAALVFSSFTLVGLFVAVIGVTRITGTIEIYLLWWIAVLGASLLAGWLIVIFGDNGLLASALERWPDASHAGRVILPTACVLAGLSLTSAAFDRAPLESQSIPATEQAWSILAPHLGAKGTRYYLDIRDQQVLPYAAGVAVLLDDAGYRYDVPEQYAHVFGKPEDGLPSASDHTISLAWAGAGNDVGPPPDGVTTDGEFKMAIRIADN